MKLPDIQGEITYKTSRSGGKGGQHVNKVESRVEARWNLMESAACPQEKKDLLISKLGARLSAEGVLSVTASDTRSQQENKILATRRLLSLVSKAFLIPRKRHKTSIPKAAKEKRLSDKKVVSQRKADRRGGFD